MPSYTIQEITSDFPLSIRVSMDELLMTLAYRPIWQTIEWQLMLKEANYTKKSFFIGVYEEEELMAYVLLEKRTLGLWFHGFFAVGGPIGSDPASLECLSLAIQKLATEERVVFIELEPLESANVIKFTQGTYKDFLEKHTALISLTQDEETILARMKPKGRYNIRVAEKAGVQVEQVSFSEEGLSDFYNLLTETLERDKFAANSKSYFRSLLQYLEKQGLGGLFLAKRDGETIAAGIFVFLWNTALYYYWASSSDNAKRKYMASYLLQWEAIKEAKKRWCETYDFLGIADPKDENSHLAGVTDFKLKLTDETREWPKSQILVMRKLAYAMLKVRKIAKHIRG